MKMLTSGGTAIAAAILLCAAPAAAQQQPAPAADQDALCFVAVSSFFGQIGSQKVSASPEMVDQTKVALGFYAGRLTQRFPGTNLASEIRAAKTATFAMSLEEQKTLLASCIRTFQGDLRTLVQASAT